MNLVIKINNIRSDPIRSARLLPPSTDFGWFGRRKRGCRPVMGICSPSEWISPTLMSTKVIIVHGIALGVAAVGVYAAFMAHRGKFRSRVVGIIPARFASSRFQGKPLVQILGKPMIQVIFYFGERFRAKHWNESASYLI